MPWRRSWSTLAGAFSRLVCYLYQVPSRVYHLVSITKKSIENFFPCVNRWSRRKDRKLKIQVPLFPGYIFVKISFTPYNAFEVLKINGVVRFLGENNQRPVDIPDIQIESLKTVIASGEQILPFAYLRVGQRVRVRRGPLEGCEGLLVRMNTGKDRLVISLELLQRSVSVELDAADVTPL